MRVYPNLSSGSRVGYDECQNKNLTHHPPLPPRRLCILVVDDNADAAHMLGALCEQLGHDVDFAYDGQSGLEAGRRLRPDLVFADLALPGMDGFELARQCVSNRRCATWC